MYVISLYVAIKIDKNNIRNCALPWPDCSDQQQDKPDAASSALSGVSTGTTVRSTSRMAFLFLSAAADLIMFAIWLENAAARPRNRKLSPQSDKTMTCMTLCDSSSVAADN